MDWRNYKFWRKNIRRLDETTTEFDILIQRTIKKITIGKKLEEVFNCSKGHPPILKKYLGGEISLETLVIFEKIFSFGKKFNRKLKDPVWETVNMKMKKYVPFLNINVFQYKKILRDIIDG